MSTVSASGPEYHCWTLVVEAMHEYGGGDVQIVLNFSMNENLQYQCFQKINKKDLHGVGYIPFIKTTLCIF
jgi:hypothetical protein